MPQLHFSVDDETAERLGREAAARGLSLSKYIASLVARELGDQWPGDYLPRVVGSCADDDLTEPAELALDDIEV